MSEGFQLAQLAFFVVAGTVSLAILKLIYERVLRPHWYLKDIPGPSGARPIAGHMRLVLKGAPGEYHKAWHEKYGSVINYDGFLNVRFPHSCSNDALAILTPFTNAYRFLA